MTTSDTCPECGAVEVERFEDVEPMFGEIITWCRCDNGHTWAAPLT
jgi:hypothetical protein